MRNEKGKRVCALGGARAMDMFTRECYKSLFCLFVRAYMLYVHTCAIYDTCAMKANVHACRVRHV